MEHSVTTESVALKAASGGHRALSRICDKSTQVEAKHLPSFIFQHSWLPSFTPVRAFPPSTASSRPLNLFLFQMASPFSLGQPFYLPCRRCPDLRSISPPAIIASFHFLRPFTLRLPAHTIYLPHQNISYLPLANSLWKPARTRYPKRSVNYGPLSYWAVSSKDRTRA